MVNLGFERFHTALTMDGAVHEFELGTVRNLPAPDEIDWSITPKRTRNRRIVLWRTTLRVLSGQIGENKMKSLRILIAADAWLLCGLRTR
jgi:hypothetical protein